MIKNNYNYQYFSGANAYINIKTSEGADKSNNVLECAGISYSTSSSQQPVYGYASHLYDAMLPGRVIVQGTFVVNYVEPFYIEKKLNTGYDESSDQYFESPIEIGTYFFPLFDIDIIFGNNNNKSLTIKHCALISSGQTIQVNEQVILQEYGFIGRHAVPYKK